MIGSPARGRGWRRRLRRRVVLNLKTGNAIAGVLFDTAGTLLILRDAELLVADQAPTKIDGEALVELDEVEFAQLIPAPTR